MEKIIGGKKTLIKKIYEGYNIAFYVQKDGIYYVPTLKKTGDVAATLAWGNFYNWDSLAQVEKELPGIIQLAIDCDGI